MADMRELRGRNDEELNKREGELRDQLFKLRFQVATGQNENPGRIRLARRDLARVKTVMSERKRSGEKAATASEKE